METGFFYVFLIGAIIVALSAAGITRMVGGHISSINWVLVFRVILGLAIGLAICYLASSLGVTAGVIGLIGGFVLGMLLPTIISWVFKAITLKWWIILLVVVVILAAAVAAFL